MKKVPIHTLSSKEVVIHTLSSKEVVTSRVGRRRFETSQSESLLPSFRARILVVDHYPSRPVKPTSTPTHTRHFTRRIETWLPHASPALPWLRARRRLSSPAAVTSNRYDTPPALNCFFDRVSKETKNLRWATLPGKKNTRWGTRHELRTDV